MLLVAGDQLLKGAAWNAMQIAEELAKLSAKPRDDGGGVDPQPAATGDQQEPAAMRWLLPLPLGVWKRHNAQLNVAVVGRARWMGGNACGLT